MDRLEFRRRMQDINERIPHGLGPVSHALEGALEMDDVAQGEPTTIETPLGHIEPTGLDSRAAQAGLIDMLLEDLDVWVAPATARRAAEIKARLEALAREV